jgi:hypothetical protein
MSLFEIAPAGEPARSALDRGKKNEILHVHLESPIC